MVSSRVSCQSPSTMKQVTAFTFIAASLRRMASTYSIMARKAALTCLYAVAGCLELLPASMLLFAPSFNAYRRFQPGNHAPTEATWGYDNRTTALRIPESPAAARRIEHRVAGADANPYLVLAAVLAGIWHGIENKLNPPSVIDGNAWDQDIEAPKLPRQWIKRSTFSATKTNWRTI